MVQKIQKHQGTKLKDLKYSTCLWQFLQLLTLKWKLTSRYSLATIQVLKDMPSECIVTRRTDCCTHMQSYQWLLTVTYRTITCSSLQLLWAIDERPLKHFQTLVIVFRDSTTYTTSVSWTTVSWHLTWTTWTKSDVKSLDMKDRLLQERRDTTGKQTTETVMSTAPLSYLSAMQSYAYSSYSTTYQWQVPKVERSVN